MCCVATSVGKDGRVFSFDEESKNHMFQKFQEEYGVSVEEMFETYSKEEIFKSISMFSLGYFTKELLDVLPLLQLGK